MKDIFARCSKKIAVQVCTSYNNVFMSVQSPYVLLVCLEIILYPGLIHFTDCCLFSQVKINHDSHEFILESGTVANNTGVYI
jgi:hypothetical protein